MKGYCLNAELGVANGFLKETAAITDHWLN